jgi:uncharacterized protein
LFGPGPKRILAIDGGGARGILACGILKRIETLLAARLPLAQRDSFRLHHYYDLIGGTSTGSILAAGLCIGLKVDDLKKLYLSMCPRIFLDRKVAGVQKPRFDAAALADELDRVLREENGVALPMPLKNPPRNGKPLPSERPKGKPITLGSDALQTGFAVFAKRIDTGGAWALTNNSNWIYYDQAAAKRQNHPQGKDFFPNKDYPLGRLVQASAAAPTYFESVGLGVNPAATADGAGAVRVPGLGSSSGVFVDGGLSGRNTPALQMLFMVTHPAYGFNWPTGEDQLMITSVGTGWWRPRVTDPIVALRPLSGQAKTAFQAIECLQTMIHDSSLHALTMLQSMSRHPLDPKKRWRIDGEIGDLSGYLLTPNPLIRFRRMDVRLDKNNLKELFGHPLEQEIQRMEGENISFLNTKANVVAADAWGETAAVMRLRELAEADRNVLLMLHHIGQHYANHNIDDDDFPSEFNPKPDELRGAPDVGVVDPPRSEPESGKGWFRR